MSPEQCEIIWNAAQLIEAFVDSGSVAHGFTLREVKAVVRDLETLARDVDKVIERYRDAFMLSQTEEEARLRAAIQTLQSGFQEMDCVLRAALERGASRFEIADMRLALTQWLRISVRPTALHARTETEP